MNQENRYEEGRYLYCIINSNSEKCFGQIGVEDNEVSIVSFQDIGVVLHSCNAKPYETTNKEKAGEWILAHQYVIDLATDEYGTVIPLTFDTIFKGNSETVKKWLSEEYPRLKESLAKLSGKAEYGVQIFLEPEPIDSALNNSEEIQMLRKQIENTSSGAAYLLKKKLEKAMQLEKQLIVDRHARDIYDQIGKLVDEVKLGSTNREVPEKWQGKHMFLNLSCLVKKERIEDLGNALGQIKNQGLAVRFTGPWPPYSFAGQINESKTEGTE